MTADENSAGSTAQGLLIQGILTFTVPASATAIAIKAYRNQGANVQVGSTQSVSCTAGALVAIPFAFRDAGLVYTDANFLISVAFTAAAGAGTVNYQFTVEPISLLNIV